MSRVVPSRMNLQIYKQRVISAKKGYDLLKKKCDALKMKFRAILGKLIETKKNLGINSHEAFMFIAKSQWAAGDFGQRVRESVTRASIRLDMSEDNVAGVTLPKFVMRQLDDTDLQLEKVGVFGGGQIIEQTREKFKEFLQLVIDIASLQTSFLTLDEVIKVTSRRVNALEYIVIPKFQDVVRYIIQELDEQAREEKYTTKKVLDTRMKLAAETALMQKNKAAANKGAGEKTTPEENIIEEDPDMIF